MRKLVDAATPGPWTWNDCQEMLGHGDAPDAIIETDSGCYGPEDYDRAFIAASRTLMPVMADEIDALLTEVAQARRERDEWKGNFDQAIKTAVYASNDAERALREEGLL